MILFDLFFEILDRVAGWVLFGLFVIVPLGFFLLNIGDIISEHPLITLGIVVFIIYKLFFD